MSQVVGAISMSHAPGVLGWPDAPEPRVRQAIEDAHAECARRLEAYRPDLIIAFLDDHFENHFRSLMPTFSIGIAPGHSGPAQLMLETLGFEAPVTLPSDPELAEHILGELVRSGFDVARMGKVLYGNNLMVPLKVIRPQFDIPVVPIYINVFSPPLTTMARAYDFGGEIRRIVEAVPDARRIVFLATGGLSHWPPVWNENSPSDDGLLQRLKRFQTEGPRVGRDDPNLFADVAQYEIDMAARMEWPLGHPHPLVNPEWDRDVLAALGRGDADYLRAQTFEQVETGGGHGGHEILNWMAVMGAMRGAAADVIAYEPVIEWVSGMGYVAYPATEKPGGA